MVEWPIEAFRASPSARSIVVACPPGHVHDFGGHDLRVVPGGATRAASVANALEAVGTELVAIHDAARPLVTPDLIEGVVATLIADPDASGAIAATPVTDTIKQAGEGPSAVVETTLDRGRLWAAQTPQVFRTELLRAALEKARAEGRSGTDCAQLVEALGVAVRVVPGDADNWKITDAADLDAAARALEARR